MPIQKHTLEKLQLASIVGSDIVLAGPEAREVFLVLDEAAARKATGEDRTARALIAELLERVPRKPENQILIDNARKWLGR